MCFSAAHFLEEHPICSRIHGHNYKVVVAIISHMSLGDLRDGMVVDFGVVKEATARIIEPMDHRLLIPGMSPILRVIEKKDGMVSIHKIGKGESSTFKAEDVCILPVSHTTAECLAHHICNELVKARPELSEHHLIVSVEENEGSVASYRRE